MNVMPELPPSPTTDDPLPDLMRGLRGTAPAERLRAAKDLGRLGWLARDALPALVTALADDDPRVREAAAHAVGLMGPDALPALSRMLAHSDKYVRRHAVWALGKLGPLARPALAELCTALRDADPRTASGAAQALGNLGADGADAVPPLAEAMRGTNIVLCRLAAKALSQIGTPALSTLIAHLQHSDPFVRGESALAIGWMGAVARPAVPFLAQIVRGPRSALTRTPPPVHTPGPPGEQSFALADSAAITPPQPPPPPDVVTTEEACRVSAAQALGRIGPPAATALPDLHDAIQSGSEALRHAAQQAVRQIQGG
jgi:HEAT repeat protein